MFRLLLLALVLAVPTSEALKCYLCSDILPSSKVLSGHLTEFQQKTAQSCADFDAGNDKFIGECSAESTGCVKLFSTSAKLEQLGGGSKTQRGCSAEEENQPAVIANSGKEGCVTNEESGTSACFCTGELCNSAGLTSPALLLLAASLLAALLKA